MTELEKWDFASTKMKMEVWRQYIAQMMSMVVFVLIQMEIASDTPFFTSSTIATFSTSNVNDEG